MVKILCKKCNSISEYDYHPKRRDANSIILPPLKCIKCGFKGVVNTVIQNQLDFFYVITDNRERKYRF